jgi:ubiquinone/menaquinone biosynthesis C-methylase UbiE
MRVILDCQKQIGLRTNMCEDKLDFDKLAGAWDENPARVKLAKDIADALSKQIVWTPDMSVLDFGCGTGLLTVELEPFVRSITGVDASQGMLDILNQKIARLNLANVKTMRLDSDKASELSGSYNLIVSNMTLHHIKEIEPLFQQFFRITAPGGCLGIADLDLDDGQFHEDNTGVFHFGFDRTALRNIFVKAGYHTIRDITAAKVMKPDRTGEIRSFTVFLMTGKK